MKTLISISGKKFCGKDTAAKVLIDNYGFSRVAFADAVKEHMYILNPYIVMDDDEWENRAVRLRDVVDSHGWDYAKTQYPEVRRLLQIYATEIVRDKFGENVWVDLAFKKIKEENLETVVLTDTRFKNEIDTAKNTNGILIKIKSNRTDNSDTHASEQDLPDELFDYIVTNYGTLEEFQEKIKELWWKIQNEKSLS